MTLYNNNYNNIIAPKALTSPDAEDPIGLRPILVCVCVTEKRDFCEE